MIITARKLSDSTLTLKHMRCLSCLTTNLGQIVLQNNPEGGLLVFLRLWRFVRIAHGFLETYKSERAEQLADALKEKKTEIEGAQYRIFAHFRMRREGGGGGEEGSSERVALRMVAVADP